MDEQHAEAAKYTAAAFIVIKGAFDGIWWPTIFASLKSKNLPVQQIKLLRDYLQNRTVIYELIPEKREAP